jgi:predicted amidohydrolase
MNMKIAAVQMDILLGNVDRNLAAMTDRLRETSAAGATLTLFPECAVSGYCFDSLDEARPFAQPVSGPAVQHMVSACRELGTHAVFGMLEADGERLFNTAVLAGPQGVIGSYRKVHLPYLGADRFTTPGDRPFAVQEAAGVRIGMNICYDAGLPESARCLALLGADLIALPTNWPPGAECVASFVINTRAMENAVYFAACNRVGTERGFRFIGSSRICAPNGTTLASADHDQEAILYAEIDPAVARNKRVNREPGRHAIDRIADRRPEMYGLLTQPHSLPRPGGR